MEWWNEGECIMAVAYKLLDTKVVCNYLHTGLRLNYNSNIPCIKSIMWHCAEMPHTTYTFLTGIFLQQRFLIVLPDEFLRHHLSDPKIIGTSKK